MTIEPIPLNPSLMNNSELSKNKIVVVHHENPHPRFELPISTTLGNYEILGQHWTLIRLFVVFEI